MVAEQFKGTLLILSGGARELWGRAMRDVAVQVHGRMEQLSGRAVLACVRARSCASTRPGGTF